MSQHKVNQRVKEFIKNPKKALWTLTWPILIGMLVQTLYNVVDTAFVGRLGSESIAALTFAFPIFFIFIAINSGLGAGMSSRISRFLGEHNKKQAENTAVHGLILSLIFALIIFTLGMIFMEPLLILFGAKENVLELSKSYLSIIFFGIFFMLPVWIFHSIFTSQGDSKTAARIQIMALIINIILDPIFIYVLGYGVKGAAIATVIAFFIGLILAIYYLKKKSILDIRLKNFKFSSKILKDILFVGMPATFMMLMMSLSVIFTNRFMISYSVEHVASFGIAFRLESLAIMPLVALSLAILPLIGMFYGSKKYDLLKEITFYGIKIGAVVSLILGVVLFLFSPIFLRIFTSDSLLIGLGTGYIRVIVFTYPFVAISLISSRVLQGIGKGLPGFIVNLFRGFLIYAPLAYLFVFVFEKDYLFVPFSMITSSLIAAFIAIIWLGIKFKKLTLP